MQHYIAHLFSFPIFSQLVESAAKDKEEILGSHDPINSSSAGATAEVEDLKKRYYFPTLIFKCDVFIITMHLVHRLAEAQGRCTTLETEQGVPLTYPTYDPNLFYTKVHPFFLNNRIIIPPLMIHFFLLSL